MTALVVVLSVTSTLAAGLSAGAARATRTAEPPPMTWRRLALIVAANVVGLPLLAWALASAFGNAGASGLVVAAAAPGGSTGPLLAVLAGGDAPLAARLYLLLTAAGTVGGLVALAVVEPVGLAALGTAALIVIAFGVVPLVLGWLAGARWPIAAVRVARWTARASLALLLGTIVLLAMRHGSAGSIDDFVVAAIVVAASLAIGLALRRRPLALAVAQTSAVRNLTLSLLTLAALRQSGAATAAVLAYGAVMYTFAGIVVIAARVKGPG